MLIEHLTLLQVQLEEVEGSRGSSEYFKELCECSIIKT